jgi:RNA-binding protein 8A
MCLFLAIEGWVIFVRNIHTEAHEDDVHELFAEYGDIKNINLNLERRTGYVKGYALIEYHSKDDAQKAIEEMHEKDFRDQQLSVDWAFVDGPIHNSYTNLVPSVAYEHSRKQNSGNRGKRGDYLGRRKRSPSPQGRNKR